MHSIDINDDSIFASMDRQARNTTTAAAAVFQISYLTTAPLTPRHRSLQHTLHPAATSRRDRPHYQSDFRILRMSPQSHFDNGELHSRHYRIAHVTLHLACNCGSDLKLQSYERMDALAQEHLLQARKRWRMPPLSSAPEGYRSSCKHKPTSPAKKGIDFGFKFETITQAFTSSDDRHITSTGRYGWMRRVMPILYFAYHPIPAES
jgi:hypothetical protein